MAIVIWSVLVCRLRSMRRSFVDHHRWPQSSVTNAPLGNSDYATPKTSHMIHGMHHNSCTILESICMKNLPFDQPGRFWKGNLHTHSTNSDGTLTPEQVCRRYAEAGYDFLALTEHFMPRYKFPITDTRHLRTETFTTLLGAELHTGQAEMGEQWHILAVGLPLDFAPPVNGENGAADYCSCARCWSAFVSMAHPESLCAPPKADAISHWEMSHAVEVYNAGSGDENDRAQIVGAFLEVLLRPRYIATLPTPPMIFTTCPIAAILPWVGSM